MEKTAAGAIRLDPAAVKDELRDGALSGVGDDLVGCAGGALDIDLGEGDFVAGEKTLSLAAVAAPVG